VKVAEFLSWKVKNWAKNLCASRYFGAVFEALAKVQIALRLACWKSLPVYFLTEVEFFNLVSIFPSKSAFSQDCFLCVQKGAVRSFFACFLTFWGPKPCPNFLSKHQNSCFLMTNRKLQAIFHLDLPILRVAQGARRTGRKNLFFNQKISK